MDTPTIKNVIITPHEHGVLVSPIWEGVDRPNVGGWVTTPRLATRLVNAILAGAVHKNARIVKDVNGQTYVTSDAYLIVSGKYMNADLKRLGF